MIQPCQDDGAICLYVFTHYNYYILKYRIDLSDCIFSSLKLSCKKDLVLPWNALPLIVIQSQITNKAQSCFSLKANDPTSLSCSWQNHTVKIYLGYEMMGRDRSTYSVYHQDRSLAFQTTFWNCLPLSPEYIQRLCACTIPSPGMHLLRACRNFG